MKQMRNKKKAKQNLSGNSVDVCIPNFSFSGYYYNDYYLRDLVFRDILFFHFIEKFEGTTVVSNFFTDRNHRVVMKGILLDTNRINPVPDSTSKPKISAASQVGNYGSHSLTRLKNCHMVVPCSIKFPKNFVAVTA